jgi:hypothetical protein
MFTAGDFPRIPETKGYSLTTQAWGSALEFGEMAFEYLF